jgi:streptogramin lyase
VVVDWAYNGWFSASIPVSLIPENFPPSAQEGVDVVNAFDVVYYRQEAPASIAAAPTGSCNWPKTKERLLTHFDPSRSNVDFYFVGDEVSRKVTAQWDDSIENMTDMGVIYASILNVAQELHCLHPAPDFLEVMVLDDNGKMIYYARLPSSGIQSLDLNQLEIYYQAEIPR